MFFVFAGTNFLLSTTVGINTYLSRMVNKVRVHRRSAKLAIRKQ